MNFKYNFRSVVLDRETLNTGGLNQVFEDGEQLAAIVPYSSSDSVTVVMLKRVPVEFTSEQEAVNALESVNA